MRISRKITAASLAVFLAAAGLYAVTVTVDAGAATGQPLAAADLRVAYIGTEHRSIGVVDGSVEGPSTSTTPLFDNGGLQHYDDEASARGNQVAFVSHRESRYPQLYVRLAGGEVRRLTWDLNKSSSHPVISPDGTEVAFAMTRADQPGDGARDIYIAPIDRSSDARLVSDGVADNFWPSWSPDGSKILFESNRAVDENGNNVDEVYCLTVDTKAIETVTTIANFPDGAGEPSWNPVDTQNEIAYTAAPNSTNPPSDTVARRIHIAAPDGSNDRLMLHDYWESYQPSWSPDGVTVAFVSRSRHGDESTDGDIGAYPVIYTGVPMSNGCPCIAVDTYDEDRQVGNPSWYNPDGLGERIMVTRDSSASQHTADLSDVLPNAVDPRDLGLEVLHEDPDIDGNADRIYNPSEGYDPWTSRPSYSPDGQQILVSRFESVGGNRLARLWKVNADGTSPVEMTVAQRSDSASETEAVWSPDGTKIAYVMKPTDGSSRIEVIDANTGAQIAQIPNTYSGDEDSQPAWSPDSKQLAFVRGNPYGTTPSSHVLTTTADGLDESPLDISGESGGSERGDYGPTWSPDFTQLAWGRGADGLLEANVDGSGCDVLAPVVEGGTPPACGDTLSDPENGPHSPRDVVWSPEGKRLAFTSRRCSCETAPEYVKTYDLTNKQKDVALDGITWDVPGRQKWPDWQRQYDISTAAASTPGNANVGDPTSFDLTVTDHGPVPQFGIKVQMTIPAGTQVQAMTTSVPGVTCDIAAASCVLDSIGVGSTATVHVTLVTNTPGIVNVSWTATGFWADFTPADNTAEVTYTAIGTSESSSPPPSESPSPSPSVTITTPPPVHTAPKLQITEVINPEPTWVGHRTTVTYTVRNIGDGTATGVTIKPQLPSGIPVVTTPAECKNGTCAIGTLVPGQAHTLTFVLVPNKKINTTVTGVITATGLTAQTVKAPLIVLQPRITADKVGPPGYVTIVHGFDFPPGIKVNLAWSVGVTVQANPAVANSKGRFDTQLLVLPKDELGPRKIIGSGIGFSPVTADFLVILPAQQPPKLVQRQ